MRQVSVVLSNYTADVSGVCSALYELGGMVVIHDPSGCNSTYNTHDEPRWYEKDSLVFISGLSQMDAIMGNDEKLIRDIAAAAGELSPRFIALLRTPVPLMTGTDFEAIAHIIEKETGIPTFYFPTTGMKTYVEGAGMALAAVAEKMVSPLASQGEAAVPAQQGTPPERYSINILGATPLDFSVNTTMASLKKFLERDFEMISVFAMGSTPEEIRRAGRARVNLVISSVGLPAARVLQKRFGTPYVVGMPMDGFGETVREALLQSAENGQSVIAYPSEKSVCGAANLFWQTPLYIIGEAVVSQSIRGMIFMETGVWARIICPLPAEDEICGEDVLCLSAEEEIQEELRQAGTVIADPVYRKVCSQETHFIPLPHEAYSGRIYRADIPDLVYLGKYLKEH